MAQLSKKAQIYAASGVNTGSMTTITCQAPEARKVVVYNREAVNALLIATDTSGATFSIPGGGNFTFELSGMPEGPESYRQGDSMFALQAVTGITTQPTIVYTM